MDLRHRCAIAVMAKAPQPGRSKTRLCPPLHPLQAAALGAAFLQDITANIRIASESEPIDGFVAYAPAGGEALFDGLLEPGTTLLLADGAIPTPPEVQGFGCSLFHAAASLLSRGYGAVCLVNADSPTLPTSFLRDAAHALMRDGDRMVLGVAEDGGYYLIGLKRAHASLFADIAWSTEHVSAQTLRQANKLNLETIKLLTWFDVDDAASLRRLLVAAHAPAWNSEHVPYPAPATHAWLRRDDVLSCLDLLMSDNS